MESLEVAVLPLSTFLCCILLNEPSPLILSARVLEERVKEDWQTLFSLKKERKFSHLLDCFYYRV